MFVYTHKNFKNQSDFFIITLFQVLFMILPEKVLKNLVFYHKNDFKIIVFSTYYSQVGQDEKCIKNNVYLLIIELLCTTQKHKITMYLKRCLVFRKDNNILQIFKRFFEKLTNCIASSKSSCSKYQNCKKYGRSSDCASCRTFPYIFFKTIFQRFLNGG